MPYESYMAEIYITANTFVPKAHAACQGQILAIAQNTTLFSLLGTTYGGNGQTTFALPDCRGRVVVGAGQGPGLPYCELGQISGSETVNLNISNLPLHTHTASSGTLKVSGVQGRAYSPQNNYPALSPAAVSQYKGSSDGSTLASDAVQVTVQVAGSNQPFNKRKPYLGLYYYICIAGLFPSHT